MAAGHPINVRPTDRFREKRHILLARHPIPWYRSGGANALPGPRLVRFPKKQLTPLNLFRPRGDLRDGWVRLSPH